MRQGFTVLELVIATAIVLFVFPALAAVILSSEVLQINIQQRQEALNWGESLLDSLRLKQDFQDLQSYNTNWESYQAAISVEAQDLYTKKLTAHVSWGQNGQVTLTSVATAPALAAVNNTCLLNPGNNWRINGSVSFGPGNEPTDVITRNSLAYVTTDSAASSANDFYVVDISEPERPQIVGQLNTGPGLTAVAISGNYAYVGNTSINSQLEIIDVTNPTAPLLRKTYKLPGTYSDNTTIASALAFANNLVYLGTQKSQIAELHIIDVADITLPREIGSWELGAGINELKVSGQLLYLASPASEELKVLNIANPAAPLQQNGFDAPGGSGNGKSLSLMNTSLFLGRTTGSNELYWLNSSDLAEVNHLNLNTSVIRLSALPGWLFLATPDTNKTVRLWQLSPLEEVRSLAFPNRATGMACGLGRLLVTTATDLYVTTP